MITKNLKVYSCRFFQKKRGATRTGKRTETLRPKLNLRRAWVMPRAEEKRSLSLRAFNRFLRRVFENPRIRTVIGANLAFVTMIFGTLRSPASLALGAIPSLATQPIGTEVELTTKQSVVKPLARYIINQGFSLLHPGIDLEADRDESILPIMNGVVVEASWNVFGYGNTVVVNHKNGYASRYAHLAKIFVRPGEEISNDMVLGLAGSTGHSTGTHLHLEIYDHGIPINPRGLLE